MIIAKYVLKKILFSNLIILSSFMSIFFIISIVDNLNLNTNFFFIILLSILDSLSLIIIVPEIIFLFCSLCFCFLLKFSNELLILRHYVDKKIILLFFIFFIFFYFLVKVTKNQIDENISFAKYNLINQNADFFIKNKVVVSEEINQKIIYELNNIDIHERNIGSIKIYKFVDDKFVNSISSGEIDYNDNKITIYNPTLITPKNITKINGIYTYDLNFLNKVFYSGNEIIYEDNLRYENYTYNNIIKILNFTILLIILSMAFISKNILKSNLITFVYTFLCIILVIYNFMINFISVQVFAYTFISLGFFINILIFIYFYLND
tara:strand:+ start:674 stop:1639 length:966 start_codon:yes stop_codon:yes gene_type:complete